MSPAGPRRWSNASLFSACAAALLFACIVHAAWLCDDAFITLRSIDNWVHGYGLRWNVDERVQSYTHPAWMLLVAAVYAPTQSPTLALLLPALGASAAFLFQFLRSGPLLSRGALCLLLLASKAFVEFSTSGLENPLVHLLLLGFLMSARTAPGSRSAPGRVIAWAGLLLLTRLDLIWLIGPTLGGVLWSARRELWRWRIWWGLAPLLAWELFSLVYYGFLFPNTAYAKLATGVPAVEALQRGLEYLLGNLRHDPISLPAVVIALFCGVATRRWRAGLLALGLLLWLAYVVRIGGDFMLGRMLTPALVVTVVIFAELASPAVERFLPWAGGMLVVVSAFLPRSALRGAPPELVRGWLRKGLTDERGLAYPSTGLFRSGNPEGPRGHEYTLRVLGPLAQGQRVIVAGSIGFAGYFAGPRAHIVDRFALADPLLARLPADPVWDAGHFFRELPEGYLSTLESGNNQLADPLIAAGYAELLVILRGPLLSAERLGRILRWNLRPPRIYPTNYQVRSVERSGLQLLPRGGSAVDEPGVLLPGRQGLEIRFEAPTPLHAARFALGGDDRYIVAFYAGQLAEWQTTLTPDAPDRLRLREYAVRLPRELQVDSVLIRGRRGDGRYHVGAVELE